VICPFLGPPGDFKTSLAFPSSRNHCHRCKPVAAVSLDHQQNYCLVEKYEACPVFLREPNGVLPQSLRNIRPGRSAKKDIFWKVVFVFPFLLFILWWNFLARDAFFPSLLSSEKSSSALPSLPVSITPSIEQLPMPAGLVALTLSPLPSPVSTLSNGYGSRVTPIITRRPHGIEDLVGVNYIFKIHRVQQGWNIEKLASYYSTTVAAMLAVNYKLITPLYPGQVVIIPVNRIDVSGLPQFQAYQVKENTTMEKMAVQLNVDPAQLRYFNHFGMDDQLMAKEWIIVPR
jgi:hypothetical protein